MSDVASVGIDFLHPGFCRLSALLLVTHARARSKIEPRLLLFCTLHFYPVTTTYIRVTRGWFLYYYAGGGEKGEGRIGKTRKERK